jgi:hypothetical protein
MNLVLSDALLSRIMMPPSQTGLYVQARHAGQNLRRLNLVVLLSDRR